MFKEYHKAFLKNSKTKQLSKRKTGKRFSAEDKLRELQNAELQYIRSIEKEKVSFFGIVNSQLRDVILIKSPSSTSEIKQFLGYEWSKRRGSEGIKYLGSNITNSDMQTSKNQAINSIQTPLFNPINLTDNTKINSIIRDNFENKPISIDDELKQYVSVNKLINLLDFSQVNFDIQIKTTPEKKRWIIE